MRIKVHEARKACQTVPNSAKLALSGGKPLARSGYWRMPNVTKSYKNGDKRVPKVPILALQKPSVARLTRDAEQQLIRKENGRKENQAVQMPPGGRIS